MPLGYIVWLARPEAYAQCAEGSSASRLGCIAKDIDIPGHFKIDKTGHNHSLLKLCFQQSTSYSTGPKVDVPFGTVRHSFLDRYIANLQPTVWLQNARHFLQAGHFIRHQVEHPI